MSEYEVRVHEVNEKERTFSVRATVNGETIAHSFPLDSEWKKVKEDGKPKFLDKLIQRRKRIEKKKNQNLSVERFGETTFNVEV